MGFRVNRRISLGKNVRVSIGKRGVSTSVKMGPVTVNSRGRKTVHVAKGVSYTINPKTKRNTAPQRRVAEYFADDVATVLDGCNVFYTASVGIRGVSRYEHSFDFIFQRSANHPTRFCQAPNKFDKDAVRNIMWGWEDTRKAKERADAKLVVIGDDREGPLQDGASEAFANCGVSVIPYSQLAKRAPQELAA